MKISNVLTLTASLLITAGCAHHERQAKSQYQEYPASTYYSSQPASSGTTTYQYQANQFQNRGGTDQGLIMQVQDALKKDATTSSFAPRIEVTAQNGAITLSGSVPNDQDKQQVEETVKKTAGVVSVNNQIQVSLQPTSDRSGQSSRLYQESKGSPLNSVPSATSETEPTKTDSTLSESSKTLSQPSSTTDQTPSTAAIDAATTNSFSTRSQTQTSPDLSPTSQAGTPSRIYSTNQTATTETSDQSGASALRMNIQGNTELDRTLGQKVMQELRTDATLAGQISAMRLSVDNGKITLRGTVKSEDQKTSIEAAVQRVTGVASVDNQLQVSATPTGTSDADQNK